MSVIKGTKGNEGRQRARPKNLVSVAYDDSEDSYRAKAPTSSRPQAKTSRLSLRSPRPAPLHNVKQVLGVRVVSAGKGRPRVESDLENKRLTPYLTRVGSEGFGRDGEGQHQRKSSRRLTRHLVVKAKTDENADNAVDECEDALLLSLHLGTVSTHSSTDVEARFLG